MKDSVDYFNKLRLNKYKRIYVIDYNKCKINEFILIDVAYKVIDYMLDKQDDALDYEDFLISNGFRHDYWSDEYITSEYNESPVGCKKLFYKILIYNRNYGVFNIDKYDIYMDKQDALDELNNNLYSKCVKKTVEKYVMYFIPLFALLPILISILID